MASIETPPKTEKQQSPPQRPDQAYGLRTSAPPDMSAEEFHFLISELRDENSRSRWREAIWISIIVHMLLLFTIREAPRLWPQRQVTLVESQDMLKNRQLTYLDSPPDLQKLTHKPDTNKISDKDRIATAKKPRVDKKLLDELRDNRRSGAPGLNAPAQQAPPQVAQQQPQGQPNAQQQQSQSQPQQQRPTQNALETPPEAKSNFGAFRMGSPSVGTAIEEAARATAPSRGRGMGGDYGNGLAASNSPHKSDIDVLSDTMGVDFAPYLQRVLHDVRINWYNLIPEVARAPLLKQGRVAIEFQIGKNGTVEGMHLVGPSGDISLDRAAWGGITGSNPFPPLPREFRGQNIALRFHFYYNPDRGAELR